jgi:hypothetical protein
MTPLVLVLVTTGLVVLWRRRWGRAVATTLIALSVAVQLIAIAVPYGTWTDRVKEQTGTSFSTALIPRYSPLWGQLVLLSEARADRIHAPREEIAQGEPSEALKRQLRQSYDFWFVYAYRLGIPLPPLAAAAGLLFVLAGVLGVALWRAATANAPPALEGTCA